MTDHRELLDEMELVENLPTQERLKRAKVRREIQLDNWKTAEQQHQHLQNQRKHSLKSNRVKFQEHIILLDAVSRKDYDESKRLLELGVNPNNANEDGLTSIHQCCIDDSPHILKLLIRYGANVNVCDNDLWTPLHAAATCANLEICKILIQSGAHLLAVNTDGNMPYDICDDETCLEYIESEMANKGVTQQAIDIKRAEMEIHMLDDLKYSPELRVNPNAKFDTQNGATCMHIACANGYSTVLEYLLKQNASISVRDNDGWTPLHVATFWGHQKAIELLIEAGADIYSKTNGDETVLDLCDDLDVREFIVQKKREIENNERISKAKQLRRTSTGVSRSSSVRRASFRDKDKARKLDTSFRDVLYAKEYKSHDELDGDGEGDYAKTVTTDANNDLTDKSTDSITSKPTLSDSLNDELTLATPSTSNAISISKTTHSTSNTLTSTTLTNDYENRSMQVPLRQVPEQTSSATTSSTLIARINSNGGTSSYCASTLNYTKKVVAPPAPSQPSLTQNGTTQKVSDLNQQKFQSSTPKTFTYTSFEPDGVKYKFVSTEPIGGKSDFSFNASTQEKFRCSKCSIM